MSCDNCGSNDTICGCDIDVIHIIIEEMKEDINGLQKIAAAQLKLYQKISKDIDDLNKNVNYISKFMFEFKKNINSKS